VTGENGWFGAAFNEQLSFGHILEVFGISDIAVANLDAGAAQAVNI